jgi:putative DNA primase/helicase
MSHQKIALDYLRAGLSVVPCDVKTKFPSCGKWKPYQKQAASEQQIKNWFRTNNRHVGFICGKVSGNLEMIDFDNKGNPDADALYQQWAALVEEIKPGLIEQLPMERTQSGGYHIYFRCSSIQGNRKLAMREATSEELAKKPKEKIVALIETRGEGGFSVASPSRGYELLRGNLCNIPTISPQEREVLIAAARAQAQIDASIGAGFNRPGDAYNDATDSAALASLLKAHGWSEFKTVTENGRDIIHMTRPGKDEGTSATINYVKGCLYVWSTNTPFDTEKPLHPFAVYAVLKHNGDYAAAAGDLAQHGYGAPPQSSQASITNGHKHQEQTPDAAPFDPPTLVSDDRSAGVAADAINTYRRSDVGNAELFAALHGDTFRYDRSVKGGDGWLIWDGSRWIEDRTGAAERAAVDVARARYRAAASVEDLDERKRLASWALASESGNKIRAMLNLAQSLPPIASSVEDYDVPPMLAATQGDTLDLTTASARPAQRADLLRRSLGVTYTPDATCTRWERFLQEIFDGDDALISFIQRAVGYTLTGDCREQVIFFCYGGGANGKSVFLDVLAELMADYASNCSFATFDVKGDDKAYELAMLKGIRYVSVIETSEDRRLHEARIKSITGQDIITARHPYGRPFNYRPQYKIWIGMNHLPRVCGTDRGIWRRLRLIPFSQSFEGKEDKTLRSQLTHELPGILNWALEGLRQWHTQELGTCDAVQKATKTYQDDSDQIGRWLAESCTMRTDAQVSISAAYTNYKEWCKATGEWAISQNMWGRRLSEKGMQRNRNGNGWHYSGFTVLLPSWEGTDTG